MATVPIGPFVKFALAGSAIVYQNWDTIRGTFDRVKEDVPGPILGYYVQHVFQMKDGFGTFTDREKGMVGMHWINTTGGDPDVTWTTADYTMVEAGFEAFWTSKAGYIGNDVRLVEHRWYAFGPGVHAPNPPSRVKTLTTPKPGSTTQSAPHQVASTITFRTPLRRHWGRMYLPIHATVFSAPGGVTTAVNVDELATDGATYLKSGTANGLTPVVYDRNRHIALGITAVECDSTPDIVRRRRSRTTAYKKIVTS